MKRIFLLFSIMSLLVLAACDYNFDGERTGFTEDQIRNIIDDQIANRGDENLLYITETDLVTLINSLLPATLSPQEIADIVTEYVPTDLTRAEILDLILDLMPEDRYTTTYDLASFEQHLVDMVANRGDSLVGIQTLRGLTGGTGSGVIYKRVGNEYYVITNHHVIEDYSEIEVIYERNGILFTIEYDDVTFYGSDATTDVAVLSFVSDQTFPVAPFADSYTLQVGQMVIAMGNPLGFNYYGTVTMGVLSGTTRFMEQGDFNSTVLQHDAALSPGNSGGPLYNINGEVIGINFMKIIDSVASGIGFAIPSNTVMRIANDLVDFGNIIRPFLGISSAVLVNECGLDYGVCLSEVIPGGAAAAAGLRAGDVIVGYRLETEDAFLPIFNFNDLREAILNSRVGDSVVVEYIRDGETFTSPATELNPHPDDA